MIVVRVELHSAITGKTSELARMIVWNDGTAETHRTGNYEAFALRKGAKYKTDRDVREKATRSVAIKGYPKKALHVWNLIAEALIGMGYARDGQLRGEMVDRAIEMHKKGK